MQVVRRKDALAQGLTRYFTGKACSKGHVAERWTADWTCVVCKSASFAAYRRDHQPRLTNARKAWATRNPEKSSAIERRRYEKSRAAILSRAAKWHREHPERVSVHKKGWKTRHPELTAKDRAHRRAAELLRAPAWADRNAIRAIYARARRITLQSGIPHHVDHIIPLLGRRVSGLHCASNLQILPSTENLKKGNKFEDFDVTA